MKQKLGGRPKVQLPSLEEFRHKFLQAFGREITREERRFYRLITIVLEEDYPERADQAVNALREASGDVIDSARIRKTPEQS